MFLHTFYTCLLISDNPSRNRPSWLSETSCVWVMFAREYHWQSFAWIWFFATPHFSPLPPPQYHLYQFQASPFLWVVPRLNPFHTHKYANTPFYTCETTEYSIVLYLHRWTLWRLLPFRLMQRSSHSRRNFRVTFSWYAIEISRVVDEHLLEWETTHYFISKWRLLEAFRRTRSST